MTCWTTDFMKLLFVQWKQRKQKGTLEVIKYQNLIRNASEHIRANF